MTEVQSANRAIESLVTSMLRIAVKLILF